MEQKRRQSYVPGQQGRSSAASILIIGGDSVYRAGLVSLLSGTQFRIAANCRTLEEAPAKALDRRDDLLALLSADNGIEALSTLLTNLTNRGITSIVISAVERWSDVRAAVEMGARGYLLTQGLYRDLLLKSLELVRLGLIVISPVTLNNSMIDPKNQSKAIDEVTLNRSDRLTEGDVEILRLLVEGVSNKETARRLKIAEATLKARLASLFRKLGVNNRTQAAMWATQNSARLG